MTVFSIIELPVESCGATTKIHWIDPRVPAETRDIPVVDEDQPRDIPYQAAQALEILGHAIEYLSDSDGCKGRSLSQQRALLEAVHILMSRSHKIYFDCPPVGSFRERWHSFLHLESLHLAKN